MASWYLYSDDGQHLGPVPMEYVARVVKNGAVPIDRWVSESDRTAWRPIQQVPEICALIQAMTSPPPTRDRETTIIATTADFPSFPPVPSTQKDVPSSDPGAQPSERTLIAPAAFEREMAEIDARGNPEVGAGRHRPAAGMPAGSGPQGGFPPVAAPSHFQDKSTLRSKNTPHDPYGSTLRSSDAPPGLPSRAAPPAHVTDRTSGMPAVPPHTAGLQGTSPSAAIAPADPRSGPHVIPSAPPPGRTGPVIAFFLGGLALGAIVVVAMLFWAFRGGILSR